MILRGATVHLSATLREWKAGSKALAWAIGGGTMGTISTAAVPIGVLASDKAQSFVMTSTANTPAAAAPATLTASKAFPAANYNPKILFDSRLREIPIRLVFLPSEAAGNVTVFTTT